VVVRVGAHDGDFEQHSHGVHEDVALAAIHALAAVEAPLLAPYSVVLADWLSTAAADGSAFLPDAMRTRRRSSSTTSYGVPSFFHAVNYSKTVLLGG